METAPVGKQWNFHLENNLGNVSIVLPNHMDTLISWTQTSDCGDGCSYVDYRIQSQRLPIFKESGFMWIPLEDSVEQFTIKHSKLNYSWQMSDTAMKRYLYLKLKNEARKYPDVAYVVDTILNIDNRYIPVIGYLTYDSTNKTTTQYLDAITALKNNTLQLFFEYRKSHPDSIGHDFINNSFRFLKSIKIQNGR